MKRLLATLALAIWGSLVPADANDLLKAFPPAENGQIRFVLDLPSRDDESSAKVELIVGKTLAVEPANRYFFAGTIEEETIKGWGYSRFVVKELGPMAGTLMAVDPQAGKEERFIQLTGNPYLVRYNSRLPIVVYVPQGVEVRYRVWTADPAVRLIAPSR